MTRWLLILGLLIAAASDCTTNTIFLPNGRILICTTCCDDGACSTTCY